MVAIWCFFVFTSPFTRLCCGLCSFQLSLFFGLFASCLRRRGANICHCYAAKAPDPQADGYFQHSGHTAVRGRGTICLYWWRESFAQLSNSSQGGQSEPQRETAASLSVRFLWCSLQDQRLKSLQSSSLAHYQDFLSYFPKKTETHWLSHNLLQWLTSSSIY